MDLTQRLNAPSELLGVPYDSARMGFGDLSLDIYLSSGSDCFGVTTVANVFRTYASQQGYVYELGSNGEAFGPAVNLVKRLGTGDTIPIYQVRAVGRTGENPRIIISRQYGSDKNLLADFLEVLETPKP